MSPRCTRCPSAPNRDCRSRYHLRMRHLPAAVYILLLSSCSSARDLARTSPDAAMSSDECADVLLDERANGSDGCMPEAACAQLEHQLDRVVNVAFSTESTLGPDGKPIMLDAAARKHYADCTRRYAKKVGLETDANGDTFSVWLEGPYRTIKRVVGLDWIWRYELSCGSGADGCEQCWALDDDACQKDALCAPLRGFALDEARSCSISRVAGCFPGSSVCPAGITYLRSPDGTCFEFGGCVPRGFTLGGEDEGDAGADRCDWTGFEGVPPCEE
jgi:hypothetical protein